MMAGVSYTLVTSLILNYPQTEILSSIRPSYVTVLLDLLTVQQHCHEHQIGK